MLSEYIKSKSLIKEHYKSNSDISKKKQKELS
jgi:hypothetical protein